MKSKFLLLFSISLLFTVSCHQIKKNDSGLNLDFEVVENGIPNGWNIIQQPRYSVTLDSVCVKKGKYSILIQSTGDSVIGQPIMFLLPGNYDGELIKLTGYIKTENITEGYAGLLIMQITPLRKVDSIAVTGTTDWKKYEINLCIDPASTQKIVIGGLLIGKGKMWIDDLRVTIDRKDIGKVKPYKSIPFSDKAKKDIEFDKGSGIVFSELNEKNIYDLELLGRIWGFLKYYHPAIAKGNYNWDYELFRLLQDYLKVNNLHRRDKMLIKWINKFGRIPKDKTCRESPDDSFIKPDLSWIDQSDISKNLKNLLHEIYLNRSLGAHYYIDMATGTGNPKFTNERAYSNMYFPDTGFRLLALYRYWNMIHYFFPYRYLTDSDWNSLLNEYIPYFVEAKNGIEYELITTRLISESCDSHGFLQDFLQIESLKGTGQVPVYVQFIENQLLVTEYFGAKSENSVLKRGDIITHIDGKTVEAIVDSMIKYYPASNEAVKMKNIAKDILRSKKHYILIKYISSGKIERKEIYVRVGNYRKNGKEFTKCYKLIDNNIGYIDLETIKNEDIPVIKEEFKNTKGIIIDIRNYPPREVNILYGLGSFFVSKNTPFAKFLIGNSNNPGEFTLTAVASIPKSKESFQGKLVIIVNEETFSNAEYIAMAFHAGDNVTIVGSTTAGAIGRNSEIILPGGLKTSITGIGTYYPDGRETQRIGIVPDIEVKPTIKGIREGRDELLEKAVEIIKQESK